MDNRGGKQNISERHLKRGYRTEVPGVDKGVGRAVMASGL